MSTESTEKDNVMRLVQSGQMENVQQGLALAKSLKIDIREFRNDIDAIFDWITENEEMVFPRSSFSKRIHRVYTLKELSLSKENKGEVLNRLNFIPSQIKYLVNLEVLDLSCNTLTQIPAEIGFLSKLQELILKENPISSMPAEIGLLQNLKKLDLSAMQLHDLPVEIGNCTSLQYLYVQRNKLQSVPSTIGNCIQLKHLYLFTNQLQCIPSEIGNCMALEQLSLYSNDISSLPSTIGNLKNLEILSLSHTLVRSFPKEIENLSKLTCLDVKELKLKILPDYIGNLPNLIELNLHTNELTQLPVEIAKLDKLQILDLRNNFIPETEKEKIKTWLPDCKIKIEDEENTEKAQSIKIRLQHLKKALKEILLDPKKFFQALFSIIGFSLLGYSYLYYWQSRQELAKENYYSVGVTIEKRYSKGQVITYKFCVNNKLYFGNIRYQEGMDIKYPNQCYQIHYWSKNPSVNELIIEKPVPNCTINCKP
ncbi:leucine-rich repeat domain-containing protein [Xanthocytophaga flava]|uniref:leucine-rich repeat domain-containing protein n=1 Tax=Xanthocytophaga flava TaxID=3048013 RepID=UPI0028D3F2E5|nr:hypothetical protein [Xanthocytophaga flavus]MDJ1467592.1 hypothetical protein [Xanthocytophaga flavus]